MDRERKQQCLLIVAGLLCFIVAAGLLHSFKGKFGQETARQDTLPAMEETIDVGASSPVPETRQESSVSENNGVWVVYVTGAVKNPGVYEVPSGARVYQALDAAGGFAERADRDAVNLAALLTDGAHVRFPEKGRAAPESAVPRQTEGVYAAAPPRAESAVKTAHKIDLNKCTAKELEEVPGIGPKTAQLILQHREKTGGFSRIEDLLLVSGIGPKKFELLKEYVVVAH